MFLAAATAAITAATFVAALFAVPISGANCPGDCIAYPYLDTVNRYPRDYVWMYLAMGLVVTYLSLVVALRALADAGGALFGQLAVAVAIMSATILIACYFVQASVVPASLAAGEIEGITVLTQYNPHGIFIALEEIGYLLMSLSLLLLVPVIGGPGKKRTAVRTLFSAPFAVSVVALIGYSVLDGLDRQDRFEVVSITANWLALIIGGVLLTMMMRDRLHGWPDDSRPGSASSASA